MWEEEDNKLIKTFEFKDFVEAFGFMTRVALAAERMNHHPFWSNVWNTVKIELTTHEADKMVTDQDHELAKIIDELAGQ